MSEYCEIIEGKEYEHKRKPSDGRRPALRTTAQREAAFAARASIDLMEIKHMYIQGHSPEWISENTQACTLTFRKVAVGRIKEYIKMYRWAPQKAAYKLAREEVNKEWIDKAAKQSAEAYRQGVLAGRAEQTAFYERTFTEKMTDEAEKKAKALMAEGKVKEAMDVTYQIERLRRMKSPPVKIKGNPVTEPDDHSPEDDDLTMQLLDQAVLETEKAASVR